MEQQAPRIVVDADACPVKREIAETARAFRVPVLLVASYDHRMEAADGVEIKQVDRSSQSVDLYISNLVSAADIVVTQDFGLAAVALGKRATVLSNRGEQYTNETIDYLMARRHDHAKIRRGGGRTRGPKAMTDDDRRQFQQKLTKVLEDLQENREP
ncbi:YaiI/YqxD family protein [Paenibacillus sambharensis]|uniref:UPF0178 protein DNH61_20755 n=1 Tax=Paenibacillus sambharensis TaxID=1803190 RepID=A0A2W1LR84_9BACL|nr:YaiI/YqxD family protein [Paenibacillus sambharensis]PZD93927.1 YaiI/YqxD family protein [Paenibacillus sambharensis]